MADHTSDHRWIDCRDLRAAAPRAGERSRARGLSGAEDVQAWQPRGLRLIDGGEDAIAVSAANRPEPEPEAEPAEEIEAAPAPEPAPEPQPEPQPQPEPEPEVASAPESEPEPEPEPEAAIEPEPAPTPQPPIDLAAAFRRLIRQTGPISLAHYMAESNARYYTSRDPLGEGGDFITAPEVSQMFGELVGLWLADLWVRMGGRQYIHYVELGPGRGTLARDALAAAQRYGFAPEVHFVETSPALRALQSAAFPRCRHHDDLASLPDDAPLLIVANEFFDALPVHQLVRSADGWRERMVGLDGDDLVFVAGDKPMDAIAPPSWARAPQGTLVETSPASVSVMAEIAARLKDQGGAALIIDYGARELSAGSTLQALRAHTKVGVFDYPGEADLTAHVDFEMLQLAAKKHGAEVMGLQTQGEWLRQLGIDVRLEALIRRNPAEAAILRRQRDRLVADDQMGVLFKVLGLCGRRWPIGVGFE
ncbi:MAG: class I SAM-dependent methyltransferase [Erythrobacter sp.]